MAIHLFTRDTLTVDDQLPVRLGALGITVTDGDTIVIGAAHCELNSLAPGFDYLIMADSLHTAPMISLPSISLSGSAVTICAQTLTTELDVEMPGEPGGNGAAGKPGDNGELVTVNNKPRRMPGGNGGDGARGSKGFPGGTIVVRYAGGPSVPTGNAPGGAGGRGGAGGAGGSGAPPGKSGHAGRQGLPGTDGAVTISLVSADQVYADVDDATRAAWAEYRTAVGEYLFRLFDPASRLHALQEFNTALALDPTNSTAQLLLSRIIAQQTPSGLARDLDIAPDYKDIAAGLLGDTELVMAEMLSLEQSADTTAVLKAFDDQLELTVGQLSDRLVEAQLDLVTASAGVDAANAERSMYDDQWEALQNQIFALQNQKMSVLDVITTLGEIGAAVAGLVTGGAALVSIPGAVAASGNTQSGLTQILKFLITGQPFWNTKSLGGDLSDLMTGGQAAMTNFGKVYDELSQSANNTELTQLAQQQTIVAMQELVSQLRQTQANDGLVAAQARASDYAAEIQDAQAVLAALQNQTASEQQACDQMLATMRALASAVADDLFLARRAQEIYTLQDASDVHFDYGYLHPDDENDLYPDVVQRAHESVTSVATLPTDVITWNTIFVECNDAEAVGYDIVHPAIEVVVDDPLALAHFGDGGALQFSIGMGADPATVVIPADLFELKVDTLHLELAGAATNRTAVVWAQHSGHWIMTRPPTAEESDPPDAEFSLLHRIEAFNLAEGTGTLTANIPAQAQSGAEPGPPFAFWGRGVLAEWSLFADASATALDLTGLTELRLTIGCIGLIPNGAVAPPATLHVTHPSGSPPCHPDLPQQSQPDDTEMACNVVAQLSEGGAIDQDALARAFSQRYDAYRGYRPGTVVPSHQIRDGAADRSREGDDLCRVG